MADDYRNTEYCSPLGDVKTRKNNVVDMLKKDHPKAKDMHAYISKNEEPYKTAFIKAYNGKCAYCGVSIDIIPKRYFEIDHFIFKEDPRFAKKADAGYIDNLVLACHRCNHSKGDHKIDDAAHEYLHPDMPNIATTFIRDEDFYIRVSDLKKDDQQANEFYEQLKLAADVCRLDYLLLNMRGLRAELGETSPAHKYLSDAIELLQKKRNLVG